MTEARCEELHGGAATQGSAAYRARYSLVARSNAWGAISDSDWRMRHQHEHDAALSRGTWPVHGTTAGRSFA